MSRSRPVSKCEGKQGKRRSSASASTVLLLVVCWHVGRAGLATELASPPLDSTRLRQSLENDWLRQAAVRHTLAAGTTVRPEEDARGGVDGKIDGRWGFHTELQEDPWWQVDLGRTQPIDRVVLYNRCDAHGERNRRIALLVSDDGVAWTEVWRNDGRMFHGHSDGEPLRVDPRNVTGRYVRLALHGLAYLHLDEVEVHGPDGSENLALRRPATQSSTSPWSVCHPAGEHSGVVTSAILRMTLDRGLRLAERLREEGLDVSREVARLERIAAGGEYSNRAIEECYFDAQRAIRRLALADPRIDFDSILFIKHAPAIFPHMSDQFYCWWQRGGGALCRLDGIRSAEPREVNLTADWPDGTFLRPDLSHDGQRVLFAWARYYPHLAGERDKTDKANLPEDAFFHLFEMDLVSGDVRQLTRGRYDDFDGRYLPNGEIVFLSTRKGTSLQTGLVAARSTLTADLPDSFVRCGGDNFRPVAVYTLHKMGPRGENLRQISAFESFEWTPSVSHDGRILYTRWDYVDRFNGDFFSLWSTNPDGTRAQLLYGNYTRKPQVVAEARAIPGSQKLVFTASAHHSNLGGSLVLLDRTRGTELDRPLARITPEVCFPETEGWPGHYYANPYPLSEELFLVSWSDRPLPPHTRVEDEARNPSNSMGVYLYDVLGNLTLLHRAPSISCMNPIAVRPRALPAEVPELVDWKGPQIGEFFVQDVYQGLGDVPRGTARRLRIVGSPPKVQPHMNKPMLGVSSEEPGKYIVGTVPIAEDGSTRFRVPSGVPYFFQVLDGDGLALQTMRSMAYVQPGETAGCVGCHESREATPVRAGLPLAAREEPSKLTPEPEGSWPLRFDRLVQPILDARCAACHSPEGEDPLAAKLDLTPTASYEALLSFGDNDLRDLAFERDQSFVGQTPARNSKLHKLLTADGGHAGVMLSPEELYRFAVWMDTYAHQVGSFSPQQERELVELRERYGDLFE